MTQSILKAAGAAAMLTVGGGLAIGGNRNSEALKAALAQRGLELTASALGGTVGRSVQLEVADGQFLAQERPPS